MAWSKKLLFTAIKQVLDSWRNNSGTKRGRMSLETLIFSR